VSEREQFYDDVIAPALLALRDQCAERGMPFLAIVEWEPNEYGRTEFKPEGEQSATMALASVAARAAGNVDAAMIALARRSHKTGHSSLVMKLMGVPPNGDGVPLTEEAT
jgi:hypothetical protein